MAVKLEGTIKRFIGVTTDEKPTSEVPAGSSFLEADTGVVWRFDGRVWMAAQGAEVLSNLVEVMVSLLVDIREVLYNL